MNLAIISGNLTADPELRYGDTGTAVCSFSVAINEGRGKDGVEREPTYIDVTCFEKLAENTAEYLRKGKKALVQGRLDTEKWNDRETGKPRKRVRIIASRVEFLSPPLEGRTRPESGPIAEDDPELGHLPF